MFLNKVEICGVNTSELPLLSNEEKENLFLRIERGDKAAREKYVKGNLRLVLSVIQRFSNNHEHADDLFQVGCIGLMKAVDNFDRSLDVKFSTYAVPMILGEVRRYLRDNNSIRVSRSLRDTAYKAIYAKEQLTKSMNRTPTIEEIAKETDISEEDIIYALDAIATPMSLFELVYQDGNDSLFLMDQICDKKNKEENIQGREIIIALPNELDQDREKLKEIVDDYSFNLLGDNRDFEYAVHWNKEKTNLHAHIIYSERERQKKEPKRYKRDYYYNYEEGKMSSKKDPNAVITKHKGDIKYNKEGEIEYTDQFSKKDTQFKSREYNEKIKEQLAETLNKHDFKSRVFDDRIELPQAKLYKGASKDYKDRGSSVFSEKSHQI